MRSGATGAQGVIIGIGNPRQRGRWQQTVTGIEGIAQLLQKGTAVGLVWWRSGGISHDDRKGEAAGGDCQFSASLGPLDECATLTKIDRTPVIATTGAGFARRVHPGPPFIGC
ncbi:hypothetical protein GCM10027396_22380 [Insolitispirillum peregrinum]